MHRNWGLRTGVNWYGPEASASSKVVPACYATQVRFVPMNVRTTDLLGYYYADGLGQCRREPMDGACNAI